MNELERMLLIALEGGIWPATALTELVAAASGAPKLTVQRAATACRRTGGLQSVRVTYWKSGDMSLAPNLYFVQGYPRERLIRHLVCRQEPSAATSDHSAGEAHLDEIRDLMGATEVYDPYE